MSIKIPLLILSFFCVAGQAYTQNAILEGYIEEGLKSNLQLKQEGLNYEKSVANLNIARALFLPQVSANTSYTWADGGRKIAFPIGDLMNPVYSTLNSLTGTTKFQPLENQSIQFLPNDFHDTKLRIIQPIFNPDIYFNYKAQKELISVQDAQKKAYENELKFSIASSYYQYLESEEAIKILNQSHVLILELLKINRKLVANDKATKEVVLNAEYELNKIEQQLAEAEKNNAVSKSYFNFLLNRDLSSIIEKDTTLAKSIASAYNLQDLTTQAIDQRQELKQAQRSLQVGEQAVLLNKNNALLPQINLVGDVGYQGFKYKFDDDQRYWLVQFSLSWDLFKGGEKHAKIQRARIDYKITENRLEQLKRQIELQVIQSYHELAAAQRTYVMSQSGVKSTEKSFQIIQAKYNEGQAIMLEYLDAENKLTTARMTEAINTYELLRREAALQKTVASL
jgi:outer membrane protein TolC